MLNFIIRKGKIHNITLDAELTENHNFASQVTRYPVENGADISDHISIEPESVSIEGIITDSPIGGGNAEGRYLKTFDDLEQLWRKQDVVDVVTHLKVYQDMAIRSLSIPRDNKTGQALRFTADLQKVVKANRQEVMIPEGNLAPVVADQGGATQNMGGVTPSAASAAQEEMVSSHIPNWM